MTASTKLVLAFAVVIIFMVGGLSAYVFYWQGEEGHSTAAHKVAAALSRLNSDFSVIQTVNRELANKLAHDSSVTAAIGKQDRALLSAQLKNITEGRGFAGFITVFDGQGKVIYSGDTPAKFGYSQRGKNSSVDYVLNNLSNFSGLTVALTPAQSIAVTAMAPMIGEGGRCSGIIAASNSINEEFLTGECMKFALLSEPLSDIDMVVLGVRNEGPFFLTPGLLKDRLPYLQQLSQQGMRALPGWKEPGSGWQVTDIFSWVGNLFNNGNASTGFVRDGRFWQAYNLGNIGIILATTPIHAAGIKPGYILIISCILGLSAFVMALVLSTRLNTIDSPAQVLIEHVKGWQDDERPPVMAGLYGAWQELASAIDQTLSGKQHYIHSLKLQLDKTAHEVSEKKEEEQNTDSQFAALNRQLANQNKQLSEFSRQLNYANQQNVFLQHELQAILQTTTEGFLVLDRFGNVLSANNIFLNWLGMSEAEIAGRFCFDLIKKPGQEKDETVKAGEHGRAFVKHEANPAALIDQFFPEGLIYKSRSGQNQPGRGQGKRSESKQVAEVLLHLQPIAGPDNNIQGYILVARDKSLRAEIVGLRVEMVNMLARAIRAPLIGAEKEWHSLQENLLAITAEEQSQSLPIKQKLTDLHARYQTLIRSVESMLASHGQSVEQLGSLSVTQSARQVSTQSTASPEIQDGAQLVKGLDNIFAGGAEGLKTESFSVTRLVGDCLQDIAAIARGKHLLLDHKTSTALPNIWGDRAILKTILAPVIDKMISITAYGGKVRLESKLKEKEIQISISSSGPALSEEEIADMFAGFIPEKHSEDTYSARLSLYLARNNAERIGAHIWAQSESGQSSQFNQLERVTTVYITLPVS